MNLISIERNERIRMRGEPILGCCAVVVSDRLFSDNDEKELRYFALSAPCT